MPVNIFLPTAMAVNAISKLLPRIALGCACAGMATYVLAQSITDEFPIPMVNFQPNQPLAITAGSDGARRGAPAEASLRAAARGRLRPHLPDECRPAGGAY
jgi:hypothetical protein